MARLYVDAAQVGIGVEAFLALDIATRAAVVAEHNRRITER